MLCSEVHKEFEDNLKCFSWLQPNCFATNLLFWKFRPVGWRCRALMRSVFWVIITAVILKLLATWQVDESVWRFHSISESWEFYSKFLCFMTGLWEKKGLNQFTSSTKFLAYPCLPSVTIYFSFMHKELCIRLWSYTSSKHWFCTPDIFLLLFVKQTLSCPCRLSPFLFRRKHQRKETVWIQTPYLSVTVTEHTHTEVKNTNFSYSCHLLLKEIFL